MKISGSFFTILSLVILLSAILSGCGDSTVSTEDRQETLWNNQEEWNAVKPGNFVIEPATLICLGFEWYQCYCRRQY